MNWHTSSRQTRCWLLFYFIFCSVVCHQQFSATMAEKSCRLVVDFGANQHNPWSTAPYRDTAFQASIRRETHHQYHYRPDAFLFNMIIKACYVGGLFKSWHGHKRLLELAHRCCRSLLNHLFITPGKPSRSSNFNW